MPPPQRPVSPRTLPLALALSLALSLASSAAGAEAPVAYALIVANNASPDASLAPLRYADDDGARFYELFSSQARETVLLSVLDAETQERHPGLAARTRPPTRQALEQALAHLNARMAQDVAAGLSPVLYFVFTGHGRRGPAGEGEVYLLDGALTRTELYRDVIAPSPARLLHLIVDACDSYFLVNARGGLPVGPAQTAAVTRHLEARELERYPHVGVVLSTSSQRESHEWSAIGAGIFSHQVRSGLAGAADVNTDGRVEYSELVAFIAAANQGVRDVRGRLDIFARAPPLNRAAPLSDLRQAQGWLRVPEALAGRMWVEDARGVRLAEFHKEEGRVLRVAVPPSRPLWLRTATSEARLSVPRPGAVVDAGTLKWGALSLASRGAVEDALRERLFEVAFGPRFYSGYMASLGEAPVSFDAPWEPPAAPGVASGRGPWPQVLLGVGAAALVAGVGLGLAARSTEQSLSRGTGGCAGEGEAYRRCFAERLRQGERQATASNVLLGAGALVGAGGALLFVWELP